MRIDWCAFLGEHGIKYFESGTKNTAVNHITIQCPLCGIADTSHHLGINLTNGKWGCWRDESHRGNNPINLVRALLKLPYQQALEVLSPYTEGSLYRAKTDLDDLVEWAQGMDKTQTELRPVLKLPQTYERLRLCEEHIDYCEYLESRKFRAHDVGKLLDLYPLFAGMGDYTGRLVFPVFKNEQLSTWTGRDIYGNSHLRYKTLSNKREDVYGNVAVGPITDYLLWGDELGRKRGKVLLITEGPLDALKMDFYSREFDIRATCLFGLNLSEAQKRHLYTLQSMFDFICLLLDRAAFTTSLRLQQKLKPVKVNVLNLPPGIADDPGDMTQEQVLRFLHEEII